MRSANLEGWPWLGAPLGIDLANTIVAVRPDETLDLLGTEADLDEWFSHQRGRLPVPSRGRRLEDLRALRDALHAALGAVADNRQPPPRAVAAINAASARSPGHPRLVMRGGEPVVEHTGRGVALDRAVAAIARSGIEVLGGPQRHQLRVCRAPSCGMYFLAGRDQEWCSAQCGNRARAARHYRRLRAQTRSQSFHTGS